MPSVVSLFSKSGHRNCQSQVLPQMFFPQGHAADVFEAYTQLLTEMVLRLPYQIKKIADTSSRIPPPVFDHSWFYFLSEVSGGPKQCPLRRRHIDCDYSCGPVYLNPRTVFSLADSLPPFSSCPSRVYYTVKLWRMCIKASHPL